jgi:hypothetical protein
LKVGREKEGLLEVGVGVVVVVVGVVLFWKTG